MKRNYTRAYWGNRRFMTKQQAVEKLQKSFREEFLTVQDQRDDALQELKKARGFLYPNEMEWRRYENPRLKLSEKSQYDTNTAMRILERSYEKRDLGLGPIQRGYRFSELQRHATSCIDEMKKQRDAAKLEAIQWKLYKEGRRQNG